MCLLFACGLPRIKIFVFGCGFQIVNNRNHLLCCRKLKAECKHYRVHYICYYTNEILDVSSADYIFRNNKCFKNVFFKARCSVLYQWLMEARKTVSQNTYSFYCQWTFDCSLLIKLLCSECVITACWEWLLHLTKVADSFVFVHVSCRQAELW